MISKIASWLGGANSKGRLLKEAEQGNVANLRELLDKGGDVNARYEDSYTILMRASGGTGRIEIVKLFLAKGADVNAKSKNGETALMNASLRGHNDIVKALLARGADVNARDDAGLTALAHASMQGQTEAVRTLLANGADVNHRGNNGVTVLIAASAVGQTEAVKILLAHGANVEAKADNGRTALTIAAKRGHNETVQALLCKGARAQRVPSQFTAALLLKQSARPTFAQIQLELKRLAPQAVLGDWRGPITDHTIDPGIETLSLNGEKISVLVVDAPAPASVLHPGPFPNIGWPNAEIEAAHHKAHIVIIGLEDPVDREAILAKARAVTLMAAAIARLVPAIGVTWVDGAHLMKAESFIKKTETIGQPGANAVPIWVRVMIAQGRPTSNGEPALCRRYAWTSHFWFTGA